MLKKIILIWAMLAVTAHAFAQTSFRFAVLTDTHVTTETSDAGEYLQSIVRDINSLGDIDFVVHAGDLTDFGKDNQLVTVKKILGGLKMPLYAVSGNHEATWSESGNTTFSKLFGSDCFCFTHKGWRFVGIPCGPDQRMGQALVSRESLRYLRALPRQDSTIVIYHYPVDATTTNRAEFLGLAASKGACMFIGGHIHKNRVCDYDGIPGILCRTSKTSKSLDGIGYTVVSIDSTHVVAIERHEGASAPDAFADSKPWFDATLTMPVAFTPIANPEMGLTNYSGQANVKELWSIMDDSNIASGFAVDTKNKYAYYGTTAGYVKCIKIKDGTIQWSKRLDGRVFSTPALEGSTLITGCTDGGIYAFDARNGDIKWVKKASKAIVASPAIFSGRVYIGASDGCFRCLNLKDGSLVWENNKIKGHVSCCAFVDKDQVVFGTWAKKLYSLDPGDGHVQWSWTQPKSVFRSPAGCNCLKVAGRILVAVPDQFVWAFDAASGTPLWKVKGTREAMGLSQDGTRVFAKSMTSTLICADVCHEAGPNNAADSNKNDARVIKPLWEVKTPVGRDISPSALTVCSGMVLVPTDKGSIFAFNQSDGTALFSYRFSTTFVNPVCVMPCGKSGIKILCCSMDGKIALLEY